MLPPSGIGPGIEMARAIKEGFKSGSFFYNGIDMISDICSGDFATALDLVRNIFESGKADWRMPPYPIPKRVQHRAITQFGRNELQQIRYLSPYGKEKFEIVERLCWLARECAVTKLVQKDGAYVPLIKIHLDIADTALAELRNEYSGQWKMLHDLIRKGVLFPLDSSRSRERHDGTSRFQIRRILLTCYPAPLGRRTAIRIDRVQQLVFLLTEPNEFVDAELRQSGQQRDLDLR